MNNNKKGGENHEKVIKIDGKIYWQDKHDEDWINEDGVILEDNEIESESDILENSDILNDPIIPPEEK